MLGYIIALGDAPNTYTSYRAADDEMQVKEGELFVPSLEGYASAIPIVEDKEALRKQTHQAMFAIFALLPEVDQQAFLKSPLFVEIDNAMKVSLALGRSTVEEWVPSTPEAGALKDSLLACFPADGGSDGCVV